ncbi:MAG: beta-lactamase family protein [Acidobacteria bacterium]|nr:beta-lactamase family protein [Acidobacteriota bacterium]
MPNSTRGRFLSGLAGAALTSAAGISEAAQPSGVGIHKSPSHRFVGDSRAASEIQKLIDYYVEQNVYLGKTAVAVVVGAISPKLPEPTLFFSGNPVRATHHHEALPLDGDTPFELASITKVFNSWVFGNRYKGYGGKLGHYAQIPLPKMLRHLPIDDIARYASGFPSDNSLPVWWTDVFGVGSITLHELIHKLHGQDDVPPCNPGLYYAYSNFAWGLMGLASIGVQGRSARPHLLWEEAISEMRTYLGLSHRTAPAWKMTASELPAGYTKKDGILSEEYDYLYPSWKTLVGFGDLVSTGNDMLIWLSYNMGIGGRDVSLLTVQQQPRWTWLEQVPPQKYPLTCTSVKLAAPVRTARGWFHSPTIPGVLEKEGDVPGFSSWMGFQRWVHKGVPSKNGVFVLVNNQPGVGQLGDDIMSILLA